MEEQKILDPTAQYSISAGIFIFIICLVCMVICYINGRKRKRNFFEHLTNEDTHFAGIMSWVGVVVIGIGIITWIIYTIKNLIF